MLNASAIALEMCAGVCSHFFSGDIPKSLNLAGGHLNCTAYLLWTNPEADWSILSNVIVKASPAQHIPPVTVSAFADLFLVSTLLIPAVPERYIFVSEMRPLPVAQQRQKRGSTTAQAAATPMLVPMWEVRRHAEATATTLLS